MLIGCPEADGRKRGMDFRGTTAHGADSSQADGSAGWSFAVSRRGEQSVIRVCAASYVIVDGLVVGG